MRCMFPHNVSIDKTSLLPFSNWSLPEGRGRGGKGPDEEAGLGSWLVGAGDQQVVSRLQLLTEDHLSLVGMAVSRSTGRFVQHPAQIKTPLLHLLTETCE